MLGSGCAAELAEPDDIGETEQAVAGPQEHGCDGFPDNACTIPCCNVHDECYTANGCTQDSWGTDQGGQACDDCNLRVVECLQTNYTIHTTECGLSGCTTTTSCGYDPTWCAIDTWCANGCNQKYAHCHSGRFPNGLTVSWEECSPSCEQPTCYDTCWNWVEDTCSNWVEDTCWNWVEDTCWNYVEDTCWQWVEDCHEEWYCDWYYLGQRQWAENCWSNWVCSGYWQSYGCNGRWEPYSCNGHWQPYGCNGRWETYACNGRWESYQCNPHPC